MYRAFDTFLAINTWHTTHPNDEKRFFQALSGVVKNDKFNPDEMGEYMKQKTRGRASKEDHPYRHAISHYVAAAWAVRDYLRATEQ
jgi:hypothetical protein